MRRLQFGLIVMACVASLAAAQKSQNSVPSGHVGRVMDWTSRQLVYSGGVSESDLKSGKLDVRILQRFALGTARNPENLPLGATRYSQRARRSLTGVVGRSAETSRSIGASIWALVLWRRICSRRSSRSAPQELQAARTISWCTG